MHRLTLIPVLVLAGAALAQDGTFRTWFEAPETVLAGVTVRVIPAPASIALFALGGLVRRRRRARIEQPNNGCRNIVACRGRT